MRAHLHPTEISGLVVGHLSAYYGVREDIRKFAFQKLVPGAVGLAALSVGPPRRPGPFDPAALDREARARLGELSSLCAGYQVRCLFALAPHPGGTDARDAIVIKTGQDLGMMSESLQVPDAWKSTDFSDGWHMNPQGAARFTSSFGTRLRAAL